MATRLLDRLILCQSAMHRPSKQRKKNHKKTDAEPAPVSTLRTLILGGFRAIDYLYWLHLALSKLQVFEESGLDPPIVMQGQRSNPVCNNLFYRTLWHATSSEHFCSQRLTLTTLKNEIEDHASNWRMLSFGRGMPRKVTKEIVHMDTNHFTARYPAAQLRVAHSHLPDPMAILDFMAR